jgi:branched-chain amino acid transport system permease protein
VNGLILAGSYALVAVGLTLVFGVMRMVNFAEGQSVMIGAFVAFTATPFIGYLPALGASSSALVAGGATGRIAGVQILHALDRLGAGPRGPC